ncbi:signal peptidase I [Psychrobacillus lasiicapitis]|uniref:Signal peptidase I n=1 Tax=Psychrobacillus lasiicapitis TaxID=1636719 RepID=A0A544TE79_9BACI|nr:signal peptidase I [Psychrobacillus lasiicapitis]TQR15763.1 signal peptidase I [Psychrobacillus lasiicapitis]GGA18216.1 signal peptidase I [Psychrobacillus lasiicapitis]
MTKTKKEIIEWLMSLVIGIIVVLVVRSFVATNYEVVGESMMPTLHDHDLVIISKLSTIKQMDIIIFHSDEKEDYVKRVIGLAGDTITYENDELYINNQKIEEPFLSSYEPYVNTETNFTENFDLQELTGSKTVPPGKLFVLGDNRISSLDSRYFHFIDEKEVIGEVKLIYWPLSDFKVNFRSE